ncbi:hypothetical protein ABZ865_07320 [Streptomyces sp. NPDC047085]|uniref:hypothetical protein n=1 Tax=Streptomyces sp. NPDC047085 TaxID=3155140 RepID=UPI0033EBDC13
MRNTICVAYHIAWPRSYAPAGPSEAARSRDVQSGAVEVVVRDRVFEGAAARLEAGVSAASVALAERRAGEAGVAAVPGRALVP